MAERLTVNGSVSASPAAVFAVLADPSRHSEVDGAGHLQRLVEGGPVTGTGQSFVLDMTQDPFGDYQMRSTVTEFEPDRRITWSPMIEPKGSMDHLLGGIEPGGHVYSWVLTPNADGGTDIEHFCDWSACPDERFKGFFPRVSAEQMASSIENVGKLAG
jgi:uncharacterized protein YndB with AHSA1/START domain